MELDFGTALKLVVTIVAALWLYDNWFKSE
jgi:hypothetical protein